MHAGVAGEERGVSALKPFAQGCLRAPPHRAQHRAVEENARHATRTRMIELQFALILHDNGKKLSELGDGHLLSAADVHMRLAGIMLQHERTCIGEIIDKQKLAARCPRSPYSDARIAL